MTASELLSEVILAWLPPPKLSLSEWADQYFYLSAESSAEAGRWRTLPYQVGIMDAFTDPAIEQVSVMKSARVGYTKILDALIAYHIHQDPCPIMLVQPTIEDAEGYSKEEISPMLRDTPVLRGLVADAKSRDSGNTILQKVFPGGSLSMVGANSPRGFRRVSRRVVLFDEVDGYPPSAGAEGDQIKLGIKRSEYYYNRKIGGGSTPTLKRLSRIESLWEKSDQRRYFVPCPHCGEYQWLKWGGKDKAYGIKWPEGEPEKAYYLCEHNGCVIDHAEKRGMVEAGEWRATAKGQPGHAGFHIWAAYSYSPNATWAHLAAEFLDCKGDPLKLQTFVNTVLGETWEDDGIEMDGDSLLKRREEYKAEVPAGVGILTAAVDVQNDRLECKVKGWGEREESWLIDHVVFYGDPGHDDVWFQLDDFLKSEFQHESGNMLKIAVTFIDAGDGNNSEHVYKFCKARASRGIFACKGDKTIGKPLVGRPSRNNSYRTRHYMLCVNTGKDTVMSRLHIPMPGPGYMHFPEFLDEEYFAQLTAEKKLRKYDKQKRLTIRWEKTRARNEALDLEVYCLAALYSLGVARVKRLGELAAELNANPRKGDAPAPAAEATGVDMPVQEQPKADYSTIYGGTGWVNNWR